MPPESEERMEYYEPTRSVMQTSICQKWPIFRIPYFRPTKCRPWKVPPGPSPVPLPAATVRVTDALAKDRLTKEGNKARFCNQLMAAISLHCERSIQHNNTTPFSRFLFFWNFTIGQTGSNMFCWISQNFHIFFAEIFMTTVQPSLLAVN